MAKIIGNTTATPNPRPDWNQTDETKADYIKNKPTILTEEDVVEIITENSGVSGGGSVVVDQVQSDWNQTDETQVDYIKNKPILAAVATSGSYNDLTDLPTDFGAGSAVIDASLTMSGAAADAKATGDRFLGVEYQTVTTEEAYEHKDLPEGEKTVTINGDGAWGDTAYVCYGEDLVPRKTFNKTFPFNGITITKNEKTYHIEGTATANFTCLFGHSKSDFNINFDEDISGKTFKLITFANQVSEKSLTLVAQFYDSDDSPVQVLNKWNALVNQVSVYVANTTLSTEYPFTIPENVNISHMRVWISANKDYVFNHDFQVYVVETEGAQTVALNEPTVTITNTEVTDIFSFPYQNITTTKAPIAEYINYMAKNAKGDVATYLTPEAFGAVGDGYTDDSVAITLCFATAATTNQSILMAKKYLVSSPINIIQDGLNIIANDIVYNGTDTAIKISGQNNTLKIQSITSNGVGISYRSDNDKRACYNDIAVNSLSGKSHGIVFYNGLNGIFQNTIRFNRISAGGSGCYGICHLDAEGDSWIGENSFYGGQITNCEWAVYDAGGNSKFYGVHIEENVQGGFYFNNSQYATIFHPRIAESQRDGSFPIYKFNHSGHITIYDSSGIFINQIDLSDASDRTTGGNLIHEFHLGTINGRIIGSNIEDKRDCNTPCVYTTKAYMWGKYLIMTPYMAYKKVVTAPELDTRLIGTETTDTEIRALSQLPTKFIVNAVNSNIYLHESYCAFGFNEFEVEQANGFTCKVYDVLDNLIFDGATHGDGTYKFKVYKDAEYSADKTYGLLHRDFLGHYWQVTKEGVVATDDGAGNVTLTTEVVSV